MIRLCPFADSAIGYTQGSVYRIDQVYWTKTGGGEPPINPAKVFGIYGETIPQYLNWTIGFLRTLYG